MTNDYWRNRYKTDPEYRERMKANARNHSRKLHAGAFVTEKRYWDRLRPAIEVAFPGKVYIYRTWGGPFTRTGVPDVVLCLHGRFIGIEMKSTHYNTLRPMQKVAIDCIHSAGGIAKVIWTHDPVEDVVAWLQSLGEVTT